jgi:hypothetical protein
MLLNQKMKVHEDNHDLSNKWKSQSKAKDDQIQILNETIESLQSESQ